MTNSQYIYDCLRGSGVDSARVTATLVVKIIEDYTIWTNVHLVVLVNDVIVDASYDVASVKDKKYCFTIAEWLEYVKEIPMSPMNLKDIMSNNKYIIEQFVKFLDIAKRINAGGLLVADKEYYNQQADFVEKALA